MIRSMTGFGEASGEHEGAHYFLEIRSLNSRYFKAIIKFPDEFQGLEAEVESELRRRLRRGSVTLTGSCTDVSADAAFAVNYRALAAYIEQVQKAPPVQRGEVKLDLAPLLTLPGVLQPPANEEARLDKARAAFLGLLDRACANLQAMRAREGAALVDDLLAQKRTIAERLALVAARAPQVVIDYEKRLRARVEAMLQDAQVKVQPGDLIREVAVYAERADISEEITRLQGHIEQFEDLLQHSGDKPVGRTLDFLAQEMLREANTIASKSPDASISRAIVEVKAAIDRIKEQVQNIE